MYAKVETNVSLRYLHRLATELGTDYCLIGGWAVYYTVREAYAKELGREYLGSRDIDIGLPDVPAFKKANSYILENLHFERVSLDYETGKEMPTESAKRIPSHMLIPLYIDAMLPRVGKEVREQLGFVPPDEPLLEQVFLGKSNRREVDVDGLKVWVPSVPLLLAMKLNSVGNRGMEHKRVKDLCDIAALCIYGRKNMDSVSREAMVFCDPTKLKKAEVMINEKDVAEAARTTGISETFLEP